MRFTTYKVEYQLQEIQFLEKEEEEETYRKAVLKKPKDDKRQLSILKDENSAGSSCTRKEIVDVDTLLTSINGDRKTMQPIRKASEHASKMKKLNQFSQFR